MNRLLATMVVSVCLGTLTPAQDARRKPTDWNAVVRTLTTLTPEIADMLVKPAVPLSLTGLVKLTPETHTALKAHPNLLLPHPLRLNTAK